MVPEEVIPFCSRDGGAVVHIYAVADVIQKVFAVCEVGEVVVECRLLLMVEFQEAISITVIMVKPRIDNGLPDIPWNCIERQLHMNIYSQSSHNGVQRRHLFRAKLEMV